MDRTSERAAVLGLAALVLGFSLLLAHYFVAGIPVDGADEAEYLTVARLAAEHGALGIRPGDPYEYLALNLMEGRDGTHYGKHPFGYPLLLAGARLVGGPSAPFLVSPVFAVLAVVGMFALGRALAGNAGGLLAAALLALNPLHAGYGVSAMSHAPAVACTVWAMLSLWRWCERGGRADALLAGALCALAATVRYAGVVLVLPIAVAAATRWLRLRRSGAGREGIRGLLLLAAAGLVVFSPLLLHQWQAWGSPFLNGQSVTESSGLGLGWYGRNFRILLEQLWSSGLWPVATAGSVGLAVLLWRRRAAGAFLLAWALGHFLLYHGFYWRSGRWEADLRYYLDVFPPLILAAVAAIALLPRARARTLALAGLAVATLPVQLVESVSLLRLARSGGAVMEQVGPRIGETLPDGSVIFTDEAFVQALLAYGDYRVYYDAMFHPDFLASYAPILEWEGPWPVSRRRIRAWRDRLGGLDASQLAELERDLVARHLAEGRTVAFVTGENHAPEWRERLGSRFVIEPLLERSLYLDETDPRFPSGRLGIHALRQRASPVSSEPSKGTGGGAP